MNDAPTPSVRLRGARFSISPSPHQPSPPHRITLTHTHTHKKGVGAHHPSPTHTFTPSPGRTITHGRDGAGIPRRVPVLAGLAAGLIPHAPAPALVEPFVLRQRPAGEVAGAGVGVQHVAGRAADGPAPGVGAVAPAPEAAAREVGLGAVRVVAAAAAAAADVDDVAALVPVAWRDEGGGGVGGERPCCLLAPLSLSSLSILWGKLKTHRRTGPRTRPASSCV